MKEKIYIKNNKLFKSRTHMIIYIIVFCILIWLFIYIGGKDYSTDLSDSELIAQELDLLDSDNVFEYVNATRVRSLLSNSGIILFGTSNEWVNYYAKMVDEVAKEVGVSKVYYYDFVDNRENNNATYEDIVDKLSNYVTYTDTGSADIYAPTLVVVVDGEVLYYDSSTSLINGTTTPDVYYNDLTKGLKMEELKTAFSDYLERS